MQGGTTVGGAKNVQLISVKIFNSSGYGDSDSMLAGLDYVIQKRSEEPLPPFRMHPQPTVLSMSASTQRVKAIDNAVQKLIDLGVTVVVSAGNKNSSACELSPARSEAITVSLMHDRVRTMSIQ